MRPLTPVTKGYRVDLLKLYDEIGEKVFDDEILKNTEYYKNISRCMALTGQCFYDRPEYIPQLMRRFIDQHRGIELNLPAQPGQSDSLMPVWVRPIRSSSYYEVIDGNHRIARAFMRGEKSIKVMIYDDEAVYTPLQQLALDVLWINKQKWLYQPVEAPELSENWILIRQCKDRFDMMDSFLRSVNINNLEYQNTYMDVGSSYGWFVKKMSELGFLSYGVDRDPFGMEIGFKVYGLNRENFILSDIALALERLVNDGKNYDVVSMFSVLHHFVLGKSSCTAENLIKMIDKITGKVLFIDTGQEHESAFAGALDGWNVEFIQKWIKSNSSFTEVIPLGDDEDNREPFKGYYKRTTFACIR